MIYKAKRVDTDKALEQIEWSRKYQDQAEVLEIEKIKKYHEGIRKGLDIAQELFECSNYESKEPSYEDGVRGVIYELAKELDVPSQDIRESSMSLDEMCAVFADRIRDRFAESNKEPEG